MGPTWLLIALVTSALELSGVLGYVVEPLPAFRPKKSLPVPVKRDDSAIYFPGQETAYDSYRQHTGSKRSLSDSDDAPARFSDLYPQTSFFNAEQPARDQPSVHGPQNGWGQQNRPNWGGGGGGNQPWGNGGGNFNGPPPNDYDEEPFVFDRPPTNGGFQPQPGNGGGRPQPGNGGSRPQPGNGGGRPQPGNWGGRPQPGNGGVRPQPGNGGGRPQPGNGSGRPQSGNGAGRPQPGNGGGRPQPGNGGGRPQPGNGGGRPQSGSSGVARPQSGQQITPTPITTTSTTTPAPGAPVTMPTPAPTRPNCNCPSTPEFNPVCGQDRVTYTNPGKLRCANFCGNRVTMLHFGSCVTTTTPPPSG